MYFNPNKYSRVRTDQNEKRKVAEWAFREKIIIPKQFREFYSGILSEEALNKDRI